MAEVKEFIIRDGVEVEVPESEFVNRFYVKIYIGLKRAYSAVYPTHLDGGIARGPKAWRNRYTDGGEVNYGSIEYKTVKELIKAYPDDPVVLRLLGELT